MWYNCYSLHLSNKGWLRLKKLNPKLIVIVGVVFVSFSSILIKASTAPALIISTYRLMLTVIIVAPSAIGRSMVEFKRLDRKSFLLCTLSGVFLAMHFATWITSIKFTSIASSAVLVNTHPVFIVVLSYLILNERVSRKGFLSISITIVGGIIISLGDRGLGSNVLFGDTLAIMGAVFVSFYMIIGRSMRQKLSVTAYTFIVYLSCTITLLVLDMATKTPLFPYTLYDWAIFLALAIFCTILGHSIFNWSLQYVKPTFLSVAILGEPVFATIWAIFIFNEFPSFYNIFGSLTIIFGIYLFNRSESSTAINK